MNVALNMTFTLDDAEIAALASPSGVTGQAIQRAADTAAERLAASIAAYDLIDTGAMLAGVTTQVVDSGEDGVTVQVGTPVPYAIFHRRPFQDTLDAVTASDTNP